MCRALLAVLSSRHPRLAHPGPVRLTFLHCISACFLQCLVRAGGRRGLKELPPGREQAQGLTYKCTLPASWLPAVLALHRLFPQYCTGGSPSWFTIMVHHHAWPQELPAGTYKLCYATQSSEGWSQADWKELSVEAVITATSAEPPPSLEVGLATPLMAPSCPHRALRWDLRPP